MTIDDKQHALPVTDPKALGDAWAAVRELVTRSVTEAVKGAAGPPAPAGPCRELVPAFLDSLAHKTNARTRKNYEAHLRAFAKHFGQSAAGDVDPKAVERRAYQETWSDSHRSNYLWTVQAFLRWAGRPGLAIDRPPKESRGAEAVLTEAVHRVVLRETTGDYHQYARFLWATGCRPMEAAGLTAEAIDWATGTAKIREHKTRKKGRQRVLYLSTEALAVLREQLDRHGSGPLFRLANGKGPLTLRSVVWKFYRLSEKIGHKVTAYHYRHTYATRLLARGVPDAHVAALLGHAGTRMIHAHYSHVAADSKLLREAAEKAG